MLIDKPPCERTQRAVFAQWLVERDNFSEITEWDYEKDPEPKVKEEPTEDRDIYVLGEFDNKG